MTLQPPADGRIVFLGTSIQDDVANIIIAQLLFLMPTTRRDIYLT